MQTGTFDHVAAPEPLPERISASVFLAGPTPRDAHTASWRPAARELLAAEGFDGVVLDPERREPRYEYDSQVAWEAAALAISDVIVFWVPRNLVDMPAFTTNVEFGMWIDSGRVICGGPPDAPKNRYLAATAGRHGLVWHDTLDAVITEAVAATARARSERAGAQRRLPAVVAAHPATRSWVARLTDAGHRIDELTYRPLTPAGPGEAPAVWVTGVDIAVAGEDRNKANEVVVHRADSCAVVAHGTLDGEDTCLAVVTEFRSANGYIRELPGGSIDDDAPREAAARELGEETGLVVDSRRLAHVHTAAMHGTLSSQRCWLYRVELSDAELRAIDGAGRIGDPAIDGEVTYPHVCSAYEIRRDGRTDWANLGMIDAALDHARRG